MKIMYGLRVKLDHNFIFFQKVEKTFDHQYKYESGWKFDPITGKELWKFEDKIKSVFSSNSDSQQDNDIDIKDYLQVICYWNNCPVILHDSSYYLLASINFTVVTDPSKPFMNPSFEDSLYLDNTLNLIRSNNLKDITSYIFIF